MAPALSDDGLIHARGRTSSEGLREYGRRSREEAGQRRTTMGGGTPFGNGGRFRSTPTAITICMMLLHSDHGTMPVIHSQRIQPNAYESHLSSTFVPENCSGAMYAEVPMRADSSE